MAFLTSLFHHQMSPRSLLDFFFPHTSSHAFRTPSLKVFLKSGASVLASFFALFLNLTHVQFSFNFQIFLMIRFFLTIFLKPFLLIYDHQFVLKFAWNQFHISYILFVFFSHKHKINFCSTSTSTISDFPFACLIEASV